MINKELIIKMEEDMKIRNFSHYTYDSYLGKTRDIMKYFGEKNLEEVTTEELRDFLLSTFSILLFYHKQNSISNLP